MYPLPSKQPTIGRQGILQGCWDRMLRGKAIGNDENRRAACQSEAGCQSAMGIYRADAIPAAVKVQDGFVGIGFNRFDPFGVNSARHNGPRRYPFRETDSPARDLIQFGTLFLNGKTRIQNIRDTL